MPVSTNIFQVAFTGYSGLMRQQCIYLSDNFSYKQAPDQIFLVTGPRSVDAQAECGHSQTSAKEVYVFHYIRDSCRQSILLVLEASATRLRVQGFFVISLFRITLHWKTAPLEKDLIGLYNLLDDKPFISGNFVLVKSSSFSSAPFFRQGMCFNLMMRINHRSGSCGKDSHHQKQF